MSLHIYISMYLISIQPHINMKALNHKYSINIPNKIFKSLKIKAAHEDKSMKEIILFCIQETLGDLKIKDEEANLAFLSSSNETFAKEWNSKEDEKAFKNLQKYNKPKH